MGSLKITCEGTGTLELDSLEDFQGGLKFRTDEDIGKIIRSIERFGFSFPFFVWRKGNHNYCFDGHGRIAALRKMREEGVEIPPLPFVNVQAKTVAEAKQKLLRLNSQYGTMTKKSVLEFLGDVEVESDDLSLPMGAIQFEDEEGEPEPDEDFYTKKIAAPLYEPKGEKPPVVDLMDTGRTDELVAEIEASGLTGAERDFLIAAAQRHTIFNYRKIADYYAHSPKKVQALMERSALVIIDFKKAIENGYVQFSKEIGEQYAYEEAQARENGEEAE